MGAGRLITGRSHFCLLAGLIISGCGIEGSGLEAGDPEIASVDEALGPPSNHHFIKQYGGNIFSTPFSYETEENQVGGNCTSGYVRSGNPSVQWSSQSGGFCAFLRWSSASDVHNCRAVIQGSTGGAWYGGQCETWVDEKVDPSSFPYVASGTNSAQANTTPRWINLAAGQTLTIGTCGVPGASFTGDTFLRLFTQTPGDIHSDDACGGLGSQIIYHATSFETVELHAGCFANTSCSGTVSWLIQ